MLHALATASAVNGQAKHGAQDAMIILGIHSVFEIQDDDLRTQLQPREARWTSWRGKYWRLEQGL